MLTQWFTPEPDFKGLPFAKELVRRGHEVQVVTGFPNYPGGKLYPGYRMRLFQREVVEGIPILRVALYPSHDKSAVRRILNYVSFAFFASLFAPLLTAKVDIVYAYHAPATIALPAIMMRLLRGVPFVYDINDLWPDSLVPTGMLQFRGILKYVDIWCNLTYRLASRVTVVTPGFRTKLLERGVPPDKIEVIYNWCNERQFVEGKDEKLSRDLGMTGRFNVVFAGNIGTVQALDVVIDAAKLVAKKRPEVQFIFVGAGLQAGLLKERVEKEQVENCRFLSRRPVSEIGFILNLADVLLVHLQDDPLFEITIPSKTTAYMGIGRPILMAVRGDAANLVEKAKAGLVCTPEDPESIASAVEQLAGMSRHALNEMGERGRKFYVTELSLAVGARKFESVFRSAI